MNKKAKKRLEVINKKLQILRPSLAGSKAQADDTEELKELEDEMGKGKREKDTQCEPSPHRSSGPG